MKTLRYAAYGSNLHPHRLARRIASSRLLGTAALADVTLRFHKRGRDGSGKANLHAAAGSGVFVAVYRIDAADLPVLDQHEHHGIGYERQAVDVPGYGECFTYVATSTHVEDRLLPYCWYREMVLLGCDVHGFPNDYVEGVRAGAVLSDPDPKRRGDNWALVRAMRAYQP